MAKKADKFFFWIVLALTLGGFFIFTSASLGLLARTNGAEFTDVFWNQVIFGLFFGFCALAITLSLDYKIWRPLSPFLFIGALVLMVLVFVPGIGMEHGGARRWIDLKFISFQPTEFLKFAFVCFFAAWLSSVKEKVATWQRGLLPLLVMLGISGVLILLEPDTGTFGILAITALVMFFAAGAKMRHIGLLLLVGLLAVGVLAMFKPYLKDRVTTFLHPERDSLGSGYQIQQSLIAIGSGGLFGRGFGQSIQKFNYLPEPTNDAIFAVASEEFGFIGAATIIILLLLFAWRGLYIASRSGDSFGRLLVIGIVFLVITQSFINVASMLALFPLTGVPLLFISHGGTALFTVLAEVGVVLSVSKHMRA